MIEVNTDKEQYWLDHIEAATRSGLSIVQYARQYDIKAQRLYQWRNIVKNRSTPVSTEEKFTRVVTSTLMPGARMTLTLSSATLEFDSLPDPQWLSLLMTCTGAQK